MHRQLLQEKVMRENVMLTLHSANKSYSSLIFLGLMPRAIPVWAGKEGRKKVLKFLKFPYPVYQNTVASLKL